MSLYLFIDTACEGQIRLAVFSSDKKLHTKKIETDYDYSEKLVSGIDVLLNESGIQLKDLRGIVVVEGPGRFSAVRAGVSTANALAWSLDIPVMPVTEKTGDKEILNSISSCNTDKFNRAIAPVYGQEPNISKPKKR